MQFDGHIVDFIGNTFAKLYDKALDDIMLEMLMRLNRDQIIR